ncbi:putative Dynein intermediate chain 3, ciliary [Blattamonas nauphoetae]|uniref:Dynein intermediate chain 3, ciliary n=1 Tax=Blattamonas nauphoetae TaxID=2049346 RepID=A0ABQ9Y682_9EUKA|nr:putative Dynein intermediate chain 3, ciliary [Blattamonas nauphoetae]
MDIIFPYSRKRKEFGKHCTFTVQGPETVWEDRPNQSRKQKYDVLKMIPVAVQAVPQKSEHDCNTEIVVPSQRGMMHLEGGWPKDIDPTQPDSLNMFRKKVERDENFLLQLISRANSSTSVVNQNLSLDIYQTYFSDYQADVKEDAPKATIQAVFRDPFPHQRRWAKNIAWHPEIKTRLAAAYSILKFQSTSADLPIASHVWDINNPNNRLYDLHPTSPLCSIQYNFKDSNIIAGGCYNGVLQLWDPRKGTQPYDKTPLEVSHHDPIYKVQWLQSKTGTECATVSSDGTVKWWDIRHFDKPIEQMDLLNKLDMSKLNGTSMDYDPAQGPSKFMIGTEQGLVLSCNRKAKTSAEKVTPPFFGHIGPVYSVQRNPFHSRFFMSVGDWTVKLWIDDLRSPMISTPSDSVYLSAGQWSPTKPSLLFTAKENGYFDIYDVITQKFILSQQVTETPNIGLSALEVQNTGKLIATGGKNGSIYIHELSDSLCQITDTEKTDVLNVLEREAKREKNVDARKKEQQLKERQAAKLEGGGGGGDARTPSAAGNRTSTPGGFGVSEGLGTMGSQTQQALERPKTKASRKVVEEEEDEDAIDEIDEGELGDVEKEFMEKVKVDEDEEDEEEQAQEGGEGEEEGGEEGEEEEGGEEGEEGGEEGEEEQ